MREIPPVSRVGWWGLWWWKAHLYAERLFSLHAPVLHEPPSGEWVEESLQRKVGNK